MTSVKKSAILSIDFGERYFGFAIKLLNETTIFPLKVIDSSFINIESVIKDYIAEYNVNTIIVGYPIGLNESETRMSRLVDSFVDRLYEITKLSIHKVDERFSSKLNKNDTDSRVDGLSALVNLETYIRNNE